MFFDSKPQASFGTVPKAPAKNIDREYQADLFFYDLDQGEEQSLVDDITWQDLDLTRVYDRVNNCHTTCGEEALYLWLRRAEISEEAYKSRLGFLHRLEGAPDQRQKMDRVLSKLGKNPRVDLFSEPDPSDRSKLWLFIYCFLSLALVASIVWISLNYRQGILPLLAILILNSNLHQFRKNSIGKNLFRVNYTIAMVMALERLKKLKIDFLDDKLKITYQAEKPFRNLRFMGAVSSASDGSPADMVSMVLLFDLIVYELTQVKLGKHQAEAIKLFKDLGEVDATISVASYRKSLKAYAEPILHFDQREPMIRAKDMVHPLLEDAVPNDLCTTESILITGSNASGKSTYLRLSALNALMAQSLCTVLADSYEATVFRLYSSMAISDDLLEGESYYVAETQAIKRILDAADEGGRPLLCIIDEVLRGTNTVERIAASSTILGELAKKPCLCLAATHDIELTDLLKENYNLYHFEEQLKGDEMFFDYKIKEGKATSRNAINLLAILGFDQALVQRAHQKAAAYIKTGQWA